MVNNQEEFMTAEEIRSRIADIEKELARLTSLGSTSALGGLAGLGLSSLIPVVGILIGAASTAAGTGVAASFLKKKRELQKELKELKNRLQLLEDDVNANK
jgi:uncharacterized membrane protein